MSGSTRDGDLDDPALAVPGSGVDLLEAIGLAGDRAMVAWLLGA
jgi:hypothetical protein